MAVSHSRVAVVGAVRIRCCCCTVGRCAVITVRPGSGHVMRLRRERGGDHWVLVRPLAVASEIQGVESTSSAEVSLTSATQNS